ncbi:MAG: type I restriction-modification system subunit M [Holosporaceae bacterium]|jgi:type I restriction enzyme M protein|nr:type I restriction-modification system subunit M [Holosporaceae bacterium]
MAKKSRLSNVGANLGIEEKLWAAADKMRGHMDPSEYKHIALGLIFLNYISDSFEEKYNLLSSLEEKEDKDEYIAENIFWVPREARWSYLSKLAHDPNIGKMIDEAMLRIEAENISLKGVLPKEYARPQLDKTKLGELIDLISDIDLKKRENDQDVLGRVYEYFLSRFASAEGKGGGEFYTPQCIVKLLVEMIEPFIGRVYDPCCGSGGMFVQAHKFVKERRGKIGDVSIYGQESNPTTWRLCKMNLAIRKIDGNLGNSHADTFHNDLHRDMRADFILANPPFNVSDWGGESLRNDVRWKYGVPPVGNANFAWIQHMVHHLSPRGTIGLVLANGSMSSMASGEGEIRKNLIEADLIDCMIALPGQLFYSTQIPVCLWFITRRKEQNGYRARQGETLFIDARKMGFMATRVNRDLSDEDIAKISSTYHNWKSEDYATKYRDIPGFCKSAFLAEIREQNYVLTPGRYVGAEETTEDDATFHEKMTKLTVELKRQMEESTKLNENIRTQLKKVGWSIEI